MLTKLRQALLGTKPRVDLSRKTLLIGLGAMKCGTSWLSSYLDRHDGFLHSPVKEMNFFNQLAPNPFQGKNDVYRLFRIEEILLQDQWRKDRKVADRLRAFAEIGRIETHQDYLDFFARRITGQTHFGEMSPAYALLPVETLQATLDLASDVRFVFVMRDPTRRTASHLRHLRRRVHVQTSLDELLGAVAPDNPVWWRSDYGRTLDLLDAAGLTARSRFLVYEKLFEDQTMKEFCDWLGLPFIAPKPEARLNAGRGEQLTQHQMDDLRARLDPIYQDLEKRDLPNAADGWWWT